MSALYCSPRNRKPKLDMKNSKTRKRGLRLFTMTGIAAKPTEETLNQIQWVEDMVTPYSLKIRKRITVLCRQNTWKFTNKCSDGGREGQ